MNSKIGSEDDSDDLRKKLLQIERFTNILAKETNKLVKDLDGQIKNDNRNLSSEMKIIKNVKNSLANELVSILNRLKQAQNQTLSKLKESNQVNLTNEETTTIHNRIIDFVNDQEETNKIQIKVDKNEDLNKLTKRQVELIELEDDIKDLNSIFTDLAVIIHSQGDNIETIDDHIERVVIQVRDGDRNLEIANRKKKDAQKKQLLVVFIIALVFLFIMGAIVIYFNSSFKG